MEMSYDGALVMPSNYVVVDENEMEYVEGGANGWWNSRRNVAKVIDIALIVITTGKALATQRALKAFLKANKNKILYKVRGKILRKFGSASAAWVAAGVNIALTIAGSSIGDMIARGLDKADGNYNGYVFG